MKRRIRQNRWGNWYGYEGTRRVKSFGTDSQFTAEQHAQQWLAEETAQSREGEDMIRIRDTVVIFATRHDGSTVHGEVHAIIAGQVLSAIINSGAAKRVTVEPFEPNVEYADNSPILPMNDAIAWQQPDDVLSQILMPGRSKVMRKTDMASEHAGSQIAISVVPAAGAAETERAMRTALQLAQKGGA